MSRIFNLRKEILGVFIIFLITVNTVNADTNKSILFKFGVDVSIAVPSNWYFPNKKIREQLGKDIVQLSGVLSIQNKNQILISANTRTRQNSEPATAFMQLAAIKGKFMSQGKVKFSEKETWKKVAQTQINNELPIAFEENKNLEGIYLVAVNIEKLGNYYSVVVDRIFEYSNWNELDRTDFIYFDDRVYVLNTSYRSGEEGRRLEPILRKIRDSLRISID